MSKHHGSVCKKCGGTERYKNRNCVACSMAYNKKYNVDNKAERDTYNKTYYIKNKTTILEKRRVYNQQGGVKVARKEYNIKYQARRKGKPRTEKQKAASRNSSSNRNRLLKVARSEKYDFDTICSMYDNKCLRCGRTDVKLTIDHVHPLILGGNDIALNIQPLCGPCNSSKGGTYVDYRPNNTKSEPTIDTLASVLWETW